MHLKEYNEDMKAVSVSTGEFRLHVSKYIEDVRVNGTEYEITRQRIPVARIVPVGTNGRRKKVRYNGEGNN